MAEISQNRRRLLGGLVLTTVASVVLLSGMSAISQRWRQRSEFIQITYAKLSLLNQRWLFDCKVNIDLPRQIQRGLESGVPLQFIVTLKVRQPRKFWPDKTLVATEQRIRLVYYELTRHYRIQFVDSNRRVNKRSLLSALDELGTVKAMDVTSGVKDTTIFDESAMRGMASVTFALDQKALPLPLQPLFASDWQLASEEFVWPLS